MLLIGIHGKARSGKTTLAQWLGKERNAFLAALADPIKSTLIGMFGGLTGLSWRHFEDEALKETPLPVLGVSPRVLAQTLGTEFGRRCNPDVWVLMLEEQLRLHMVWNKPGQTIVVSDLRFENEADWVRRNGGTVVHLTRPGADGNVGVASHASEAGIAIAQGDLRVDNDGTLDQLLWKLNNVFPQREAA